MDAKKVSACIALTTAPDVRTARKLARVLLVNHWAACVNLVPNIESHYWWRGKIESGKEVLLIIKTSKSGANQIRKNIKFHHPYEVPELIIVPIQSGLPAYLKWIMDSVKSDG